MGEASLWALLVGETCPGNGEESEGTWGWIVYPIVMLYCFYLLGKICDGHLTTAIDAIVDRLKIPSDVAGATLLAGSSSAPELCTSIIGTCIMQNPSGVGCIVGSAVFNLLVIVGLSSLFSGRSSLDIWWYPTIRDSLWYAMSILVLSLVLMDGLVHWWEGLIMVLTYCCYVGYFAVNERVIKAFNLSPPGAVQVIRPEDTQIESKKVTDTDTKTVAPVHKIEFQGGESIVPTVRRPAPVDAEPLGIPFGESEPQTEEWPEKSASPVAEQGEEGEPGKPRQNRLTTDPQAKALRLRGRTRTWGAEYRSGSKGLPDEAAGASSAESPRPAQPSEGKSAGEDGVEGTSAAQEDQAREWCRFEPVMLLVNCVTPSDPKHFVIMFTMACGWISIFTYFAVDASTRLGCMLWLDDEVMGLVLLAAGTSVPDAMCSILVAREGLGDMAVANAVGSNTFDILLCLGLPWFIFAASKGEAIEIPTDNIYFTIIILVLCLLGYIGILVLNKWKLTKRMGIMMLVFYVIVIILILLQAYHFIPNVSEN